MSDMVVIIKPGTVTALTGLVGTFGGLFISYLSLRYTIFKDKFRVKVVASRSFILQPNVPIKNSVEQLAVKVANTGDREFTVTALYIHVGRRTSGFFIPIPTGTHPLPATLKRDDTCSFWTPYPDLEKSVRKTLKEKKYKRSEILIRASVRDYVGNDFHSNWIRVILRETKYRRTVKRAKQIFLNAMRFFRP